MTTLTDRYVDTAVRRLPPRQRPDIERELRASIEDAVEARVAAGEDPAEAEHAVLTGLGDPARLAAGYADRPLYLIGPALFVDYTRLLTVLLATVVPIVAAVAAVVRAVDGAAFGAILGGAIGAAITTAVHIAAWTTLVFAVLERTGSRWTPSDAQPWTPDNLPAPPSRRTRRAELFIESVFTVAFAALLLLSPRLGLERTSGGDPIPVLDPWLWDTGIVYAFVALVLASLVFTFARHHSRWSPAIGVAGGLVQATPAALLIWLATEDHVLNPAFVAATGWPEQATRWIAPALIISGVLGIISAIYETVRHARNR
ncbi:permease prefix domain 1-containing protein [Catellatospora sp. NPDC049609]|uniref:permease prefix domain 1-containing protein n=1 Tax=Catellatospora sp. NPDC049609 TaxID=3155505 RepID=UPI00342C63E6